MAKGAYIQEGKVLDFRNSGADDIAYGDVMVLGGRIGVAECDIPVGELGSVSVTGVYQLTADSAMTGDIGTAVFWDATAGAVTATEGSNTPCGYLAAPKEAAAVKASVKIG